jgi:hypothetical protein
MAIDPMRPREPQPTDQVMRAFMRRYRLTPEQAAKELAVSADLVWDIAYGGIEVYLPQWKEIRERMVGYAMLQESQVTLDECLRLSHLMQPPEPYLDQ